jgi:hypothetical protein
MSTTADRVVKERLAALSDVELLADLWEAVAALKEHADPIYDYLEEAFERWTPPEALAAYEWRHHLDYMPEGERTVELEKHRGEMAERAALRVRARKVAW